MSMGFGIVLVVIGAVLAFALNLQVDWIDVRLVGYLLMGAGALVFLIGLIAMMRRRSTVSTSQTTVDPVSGSRVTRAETSEPDDPRI